ncbi:MAG: MurR/RpiR family transcriptional regulator [Magnetospiraceae bacterium]
MPTRRIKSIETRIHDHYDSLPESERKLADVILEAPGNLSAYTATELTARAGVSKAAGTRLFRRLGFNSFDEARVLARDTRNWGSPLYMDRRQGTVFGGLSDYIDDEFHLLKSTLRALNPEELEEIVGQIVGARRIFLAGYRNSQFLATYLRWQLLQFRGDAYMVQGPGETHGEYIGDLTPNDLFIAFALRRRPAQLEKMLAAVRDREVPILLITDPTARGLPAHARWTITCETESSYVLDSCASALSIARYLAIHALHRAGRRGRAHLERIERQHESLGDFD